MHKPSGWWSSHASSLCEKLSIGRGLDADHLSECPSIAIAFKLLAAALVELAVQDRGQFVAMLAHRGSESGSLRFLQCLGRFLTPMVNDMRRMRQLHKTI